MMVNSCSSKLRRRTYMLLVFLLVLMLVNGHNKDPLLIVLIMYNTWYIKDAIIYVLINIIYIIYIYPIYNHNSKII